MTIAPEGITAISEKQFEKFDDINVDSHPEFVKEALEKDDFNTRVNSVPVTKTILSEGIAAFEKDGKSLREIVLNHN